MTSKSDKTKPKSKGKTKKGVKKVLNFKTLESPFDQDFQKVTLDLTKYDISAFRFDGRSCYDNDTCSDGGYGADD